MKKSQIFLVLFYGFLTIGAILFVIIDALEIDLLARLEANPWLLLQFFFAILFLTISLGTLLMLLWIIVDDHSRRQLNLNMRRILDNQPLPPQDESDLGKNLSRLSVKMTRLTANLQNTENARILNSQDIVQQERKRIARDLHDTVSQEMFAAAMILSGLSQGLEGLEQETIKAQLTTVEDLLKDAQNDLRILLLHLRPVELEGRGLSEGLAMILKELTDKTDIEVVYQEDIDQLPKTMEDNLFRIAQEFVSNTLKHAKASRLEVYLYQYPSQVQLKLVDNGQGFDVDGVRNLSYGLKNIEDRVDDLAGTLQILSAPGKGVAMDIRLPILSLEREGDTSDD